MMFRSAVFCLLFCVGALTACSTKAPAPAGAAPQTIHGLFVGIDRYRFSTRNNPDAQFADLRGAVGDVQRFKAVTARYYGTGGDRTAAGVCESADATGMTLTDSCATRAGILDALDTLIDRLEPGDTLLFYFAGHGSRYRDDERFDQDSGYNGTILPHDARNPDGSPGDIFDVELKQRKDRAVAKGLYFVSIFDSCNSATATRALNGGQSRSVPPLAGVGPPASASAAPPSGATSAGYWAHLAAAQDDEEAQETGAGAVGPRAGVFTTALIETLAMPGMTRATFGDIIREVQLRVAALGHVSQNPSAEGDMTATFGARGRSTILFDAASDQRRVVIKAGSTSGITLGSTFALYASQKDALAQTGKLASGYVASVTASEAILSLAPTTTGRLPPRMAAEQVAHFFPPETVTVGNDFPNGLASDAVERVVGGIGFARLDGSGIVRLGPSEASADKAELRAADGTPLSASLGAPEDPRFADRLEAELRKVARVQQLLTLRTDLQSGVSPAATSQIRLCVADREHRVTNCPPLDQGGLRLLRFGGQFTATVVNTSAQPLFIYLLVIDPQNAVDLILPKPDEIDRKIAAGQPYRRGPFSFDTPGTYRFITIATDRAIRADAFVQSANGTRDIAACTSPLERLLCAASKGQRDVGSTSVGNWSVFVTSARVETPGV